MTAFTLYVSADIASHAIMHTALEEIVRLSEEEPDFAFGVTDAADIARGALRAVNNYDEAEDEHRGT